MNRTPNNKELLAYFSEFLTEIGIVMASIKQHMYNLIQVPMPNPKISSVFNSMSSIVFSTHRTYSDLKKIQSVMAGYLKSRTLRKNEWSLSLNSTRATQARSKSQQNHLEEFSFNKLLSSHKYEQKRKILNRNIKLRSKYNQNDEFLPDLDKKLARFVNKANGQIQSRQQSPFLGDSQNIQIKINEIMSKNRRMFNEFTLRNRECLQIIHQVKLQLLINA